MRLRALLVAACLLAAGHAAAAPAVRLAADGKERPFLVGGPGRTQSFSALAVAGCRYRLVATGTTLARPTLALGRPGEEPLARADAGPGSATATLEWEATRDEALEARVGGFSALAGKGTVRWITLDADGVATEAHRRHLRPGDGTGDAQVGDLLIGEANEWEVAVPPGSTWQVEPTEGTAGRVRLVAFALDGTRLADSEAGALALRALPPLRFAAPADGRVRVEVRGLFDGGGTYGLRLRPLAAGETLDPAAPPAAEPIEGAILAPPPECTFRAGPGDLAYHFAPDAGENPHFVQVLRGDRWVPADGLGREERARTHYGAGMAWFRPSFGGTYRFVGVRGPAEGGVLARLDRRALGGAPIHMGTGLDPEVRVRLGKDWTLTALGACMPGWDYLFVLRGAGGGVSMRVVGPDGDVVATRGGGAGTYAPGFGPSLRFVARDPGIYRLEGRAARGDVVAALLRHAEERK